MPVRRHCLSLALLLIVGAAAIIAASVLVFAQDRSHTDHARHVHGGEATVPTMPGQEAFGTIQEIVRILEADPGTDWSKVNIGALREHLIDMDEVTMRARVVERAHADGLEITVTGEGRTRAAIKRMIPAHAHELPALGWSAGTEERPDGVKLMVTSSDGRQVVKIKALGFMGIMVQGAHHQVHHLMMARGRLSH
jgi:predicted RNA binding protein YcfA (HicA-like mRNA interferase family)